MNNNPPLGKLERVDLRKYWTNEALNFTPWLAQEENIALLGEEIGVELEVQQIEQPVGRLHADIVCVDTASNHKVLIENQLEKTDHSHLGQILTYAAGLDAVVIIWIAERFTDEHRAALDWFNSITDERVNFFGFEIELWRIGDSLPAPKFNAVVRPNEWTKPKLDKLTDTERLYLEYWTEFRDLCLERKTPIGVGKALAQSWITVPIGRSNFWLSAAISKQKKIINIQLGIYGENRLAYFYLLQQQKAEIEKQLGPQLQWRELRDKKESHIRRTFEGVDPTKKSDWPHQHQKILDTLEAFHVALSPRVKNLDADHWQPEELMV